MSPVYVASLALVSVLVFVPRYAAAQEPDAAVPEVITGESHVIQEVEPAPVPEATASVPEATIAAQEAAREPQAGAERRGNRERGGGTVRSGEGAPPVRQRPAVRSRGGDRRPVVVSPRIVYGPAPRYVYSGRNLPSRRATLGLSLYYGPRAYYDPFYRPYYYRPYYDSYYSGYSAYGSRPYDDDYWRAYNIGELRLQVSPRDAQVFVDGAYAGTVDDFDGMLQSLKLEPGEYSIRLEAPGYETMEFDVRISPRQKVTYREDLRRN